MQCARTRHSRHRGRCHRRERALIGTSPEYATWLETWTAQYVAMRALGEPDAFPSGDLGLLRAMALENSRELEYQAETWRPWRAYAAMYLWRMASQCVPRRNKLTSSSIQNGATGKPASVLTSRLI